MIAAQQEEVLRVFDLVGEQQTDRLQRLLSSVDVVAQEEVVSLGREAAVLKQTQQISVLTVNVPWWMMAAAEEWINRKVKGQLHPDSSRKGPTGRARKHSEASDHLNGKQQQI